jgi:hypothetical protein
MNRSGERNLDVLQNIEFAIIKVYRADGSLLDIDVKDAIDALVRHYHAQAEQRTPPALRLGDRARLVFETVQTICEWRLGRTPFPGETATDPGTPLGDLVTCLREIQKSIPRWSRQLGRQGYLEFVSQYIV